MKITNLANGTITEPIINLGNYSHEWNWLVTNESSILKLDNKLYHEQYYEGGSLCELNNKPRRTVIKLFCDEMTTNHIDSINEIETCVYEIHVHTANLCLIKNFNKKFKTLSIRCNPVLSEIDYETYMANKEKEAAKKSNEEASDTQLIEQLNEDLMNNEGKIKDLQEKTQYYENLVLSKASTNEEVNLNEEIKQTESELMKSADNLLKTNEILKKLSDNLDKLIDDLELNNNEEEATEGTSSDIKVNNLNEATTPSIKLKVSVIDTKSDIAKQLKNLVNEKQNEGDESVKSLEETIKEELMKKNKNFKDIDIKIISFDDLNSDSMANKLFSSLFDDIKNQNSLSKLNKNYNSIYQNGDFVESEESENNNEELLIRY